MKLVLSKEIIQIITDRHNDFLQLLKGVFTRIKNKLVGLDLNQGINLALNVFSQFTEKEKLYIQLLIFDNEIIPFSIVLSYLLKKILDQRYIIFINLELYNSMVRIYIRELNQLIPNFNQIEINNVVNLIKNN